MLEDGRLIRLPGIIELPDESRALVQATAQGVEVTPEGRVVGLVKVCHRCGNDPVRKHWARVDLTHLLMYLHKGRYDPLPERLERCVDHPAEERLSEYGWDISDYLCFPIWSEQLRESGK